MDYSNLVGRYYADKQWCCGETYESLEWYDTLPKPTKEELDLLQEQLIIDEQREKRNKLLQDSDFRALPDFPYRDKWIVYRQQLRDLPETGWEFPTPPE